MQHEPRRDPEFLRYYAGVLTREADVRNEPADSWMRTGAARALAEADAFQPAQPDLFGRVA